jgi:hypothetical protein
MKDYGSTGASDEALAKGRNSLPIFRLREALDPERLGAQNENVDNVIVDGRSLRCPVTRFTSQTELS